MYICYQLKTVLMTCELRQALPALAAFLLPEAAGACGSTAGAVGAINEATQGDGLTLLHRAVRSGSAAMVDALLSFGCNQGFCWRVRARALHIMYGLLARVRV